jgi:hypothetical protein
MTPWRMACWIFALVLLTVFLGSALYAHKAHAEDTPGPEPTIEEMRGMLLRMHAWFQSQAAQDKELIKQLLREIDRLNGTPASCT